jgi:Tfp pilus assembly protein PilF/peroxiredoxin
LKNSTTFKVIIFVLLLVLFSCYTGTAATQVLHLVGQKPSDFSLKNLNGETITLSGYSDKQVVILLFWSTWSRKSKDALTRFNSFYQKYRDKGFLVIGINAENLHISDKDAKQIKNLINELGILYPIALDNELKTFHSYGIVALPSTIVISENKITYALPAFPLVGTEEMFDHLQTLAGEPPPARKVRKGHIPKSDAVATAKLAGKMAEKKMAQMAYRLYKKAIQKDPRYLLPYIELAKLYDADTKPKEAEAILREALDLEPENMITISELGFLLTKNDKTKEAIDLLSRAVQSESYTPANYYFAYALGRDGQLEKSLTAFQQALNLNPFEPMIYEMRADIYESNNMVKDAASDYKKILELFLQLQD